jgi:hypothetical protein
LESTTTCPTPIKDGRQESVTGGGSKVVPQPDIDVIDDANTMTITIQREKIVEHLIAERGLVSVIFWSFY